MAIIQDPRAGASSAAIVDPMFNARRLTMRPGEFQGAFRAARNTTTMAAGLAAGSAIFSFRYVGTGTCMIHSVKMGFQVITTAFTQGACTYTLNVFRGSTISATGGTQLTMGNVQKMRSAMTQPQADMRISTTGALTVAAVLGGVEDPASFGSVQFDCPPTVTNQPMKEFLPMSWYSKPLTLTLNEGFHIKTVAVMAALGTWTGAISVDWTEMPAVSTFFY